MKILVVEDDTFIGESIKEYFELQNNKVDCFVSSKRALETIHPSYYDIFLFDIEMEGMSGFELYRELKRYVDVPVIFLTAYSDIEHIEEAFDLGAVDYIKKPFDLRELELRVKRVLFKGTNYIKIGDGYAFDLKKLKLFYNDVEVELTPNEKYFLELLCQNIGQIVSSETIRIIFGKINIFVTILLELRLKNFVLN